MMLEKVDPEVAEMLMPEEKLILVASQSKDALSCRYCNFLDVSVGSQFCPGCGQGIVGDQRLEDVPCI